MKKQSHQQTAKTPVRASATGRVKHPRPSAKEVAAASVPAPAARGNFFSRLLQRKSSQAVLEEASARLEEQRKRDEEKAKLAEKKIEGMSNKELADKQRRDQKRQQRRLRNRQLLRKYLDKAGFEEADESKLTKNLFRIIIIVCLVLTLGALVFASITKPGVKNSIIFLSGLWTGIFAGLFVLAWIILYIFLDLRIFQRTAAIEEVLPDFLQLASANISAGMPIDRALWFAVRPRFGILAKEIEDVAKATVSGEDLRSALLKFTAKYDSVILKRSINLLLEGMESGGEMAELLSKIALNIQETRILKKEMSANVMTYAIFIGFATVVAAPILFALAGQLLIIIQSIMGMMATEGGGSGAGAGLFSISMSGEKSITIGDFRIFSVVTIFVTALFSSFIISTIRKGSIKEGAKLIPMFVLATIALYFLSTWILGLLLGGLF